MPPLLVLDTRDDICLTEWCATIGSARCALNGAVVPRASQVARSGVIEFDSDATADTNDY